MNELLHNFPPVVGADSRLLVLGSLPGAASLAAGRYYAHPRNGFWRLMGDVLGAELACLPYEARLETLLARGVGLWDVVAEGRRQGSLDSAIRDARAHDLAAFAAGLPHLRAIAFNGGKAHRMGMAALGPHAARWQIVPLLSSSPACARPHAEKLENWHALRPFLKRETVPPSAR